MREKISPYYLAGAFDGRGAVGCGRTLCVALRHEVSLPRLFHGIFGGTYFEQKTSQGKRRGWWKLYGENAARFLEELIPYLRIRKKDAVASLKKWSRRNKKRRPVSGNLWLESHQAAVERLAKKFRKAGEEVWTCHDGIPDLIVKKNGKLVAYEMTAGSLDCIRMEKHSRLTVFDAIRWTDLRGVSLPIPRKNWKRQKGRIRNAPKTVTPDRGTRNG